MSLLTDGTGGLVLDSECTTTACMVVATITNITFIGNTGQ